MFIAKMGLRIWQKGRNKTRRKTLKTKRDTISGEDYDPRKGRNKTRRDFQNEQEYANGGELQRTIRWLLKSRFATGGRDTLVEEYDDCGKRRLQNTPKAESTITEQAGNWTSRWLDKPVIGQAGDWTSRRLNTSAIEHVDDWTRRRLNTSAIEHVGDWTRRRLNTFAI